jgi:hypothetical protein
MNRTIMAISLVLATAAARADVITEWVAIAETTLEQVDPLTRTRTAAIAQVAVFEAVNSITRDYEPYMDYVPAPAGASPESAAISAAHRVLRTLTPQNASNLDALRATSLSAIPEGTAKSNGIAVGEAAATAILAIRATDGVDVVVPYTPGTEAGDWQPTPPDNTPAFVPGLGRVTTFAIRNGQQFPLEPPPSLRSTRYARDYNEVKRMGERNASARTPHQADIAKFYAVTDGIPLYFIAARQVSEAQHKTLSENARIFALLGMAIFDGAVACFDTKYSYNLWRPVTAIRAADRDGNRETQPDPEWLSFVETPPFPSYPSGHAAFGAAARRVLEHEYGAAGHSITVTNPLLPDVELHYSSWKQITDDIDDARVFGGVHFRFDQEAAASQGRRVGNYVLKHQLRPRRSPCDCESKHSAAESPAP